MSNREKPADFNRIRMPDVEEGALYLGAFLALVAASLARNGEFGHGLLVGIFGLVLLGLTFSGCIHSYIPLFAFVFAAFYFFPAAAIFVSFMLLFPTRYLPGVWFVMLILGYAFGPGQDDFILFPAVLAVFV